MQVERRGKRRAWKKPERLREFGGPVRHSFLISLYPVGDRLRVGYSWGDRALFQVEFDYHTVIRQLSARVGAAIGLASGRLVLRQEVFTGRAEGVYDQGFGEHFYGVRDVACQVEGFAGAYLPPRTADGEAQTAPDDMDDLLLRVPVLRQMPSGFQCHDHLRHRPPTDGRAPSNAFHHLDPRIVLVGILHA